MRKNLQQHIAVLNSIIADLDRDLFANPNWVRRQSSTGRDVGETLSTDQIYEQLRLESALSQDPMYRARVKALEVVQILKTVSDKGTSNSDTDEASPTVALPASPQQERSETAPSAMSEHHARCAALPPDDLTHIRGITRLLAGKLAAVGVTRFAQISQWTHDDVAKVSGVLNLGRAISQQNWIEQAALLEAKAKPVAVSAAPDPIKNVPSMVSQVTARVVDPSQPAENLEHQDTSATAAMVSAAARDVIARSAVSEEVPPPPMTPPAMKEPEQAASSTEPASVFAAQILTEPRRASHVGPRQIFAPSFVLSAEAGDQLATDASAPDDDAVPEVWSGNANDNADAGSDIHLAQTENKLHSTEQTLPESRASRLRRMRSQLRAATPISVNEVTEQEPVPPLENSPSPPPPPQIQNPFAKALGSGDVGKPEQAVIGEMSRPAHESEVPPPIPDRAQRFALRQQSRGASRQLRESGDALGLGQFGVGARWRQQDASKVAPSVHADLDAEHKIYSHHEEASVEIVRHGSDSPGHGPQDEQIQSGPEDVQSPIYSVEKLESPASRVANRVRNVFRRD